MIKNNRVQVTRGVLALLVVLLHALPANDNIYIIVRPFLNCAVAGFVFLSGYLTKISTERKKVYKRIPTAVIPYILFTIFFTIMANYQSGIKEITTETIKNIFTTSARGHLYYLATYVQLVLITPLLIRIAKQKNGLLNAIILLIQPVFLLCFYIGVTGGWIKNEAPWYMVFFPTWLTYYYMGILVGNKLIENRIKNNRLLILVIVGIMLQIGEGYFWLQNMTIKSMCSSQIRITSFIENIPILLLIAKYVEQPKERASRILARIGDASFGIYLLHPAFLSVFYKLLPRNEVTFIFAAICSFGVVWGLNRIFPKKVLKYTGLGMK